MERTQVHLTEDQERRRAITETSGTLPDAPDWPEWLSQVRGTGADERLSALEEPGTPSS